LDVDADRAKDDGWLDYLVTPRCTGYELLAGTPVHVARASPDTPQWKPHVLRRTLRFRHPCRPASSGAFFEQQGWIIATTWDKVQEVTE
jgi:hypothetical protein